MPGGSPGAGVDVGSVYDRPIEVPASTQPSHPSGRRSRPSGVKRGSWPAGIESADPAVAASDRTPCPQALAKRSGITTGNHRPELGSHGARRNRGRIMIPPYEKIFSSGNKKKEHLIGALRSRRGPTPPGAAPDA